MSRRLWSVTRTNRLFVVLCGCQRTGANFGTTQASPVALRAPSEAPAAPGFCLDIPILLLPKGCPIISCGGGDGVRPGRAARLSGVRRALRVPDLPVSAAYARAHHAQQITITGDSFRTTSRRRTSAPEKGGTRS